VSYSTPKTHRRHQLVRQPMMGLGAIPQMPVLAGYPGVPHVPPPPAGVPTWQQATYGDDINKQNTVYRRIGDDGVLNMLQQRLVDFRVMNPADTKNPDDQRFSARRNYRDWLNNLVFEIREDGAFLQSLKAFWVREGRNDNLWPGSGGQTDFGPNTNSSRDLQVSKQIYDMLTTPGTPIWGTASDGFVRLRANDYLYNTMVRDALQRAGYLPTSPTPEINTKDDGPMVKALETFYREGVAAGGASVGLDYGRWPSDTDLGPNTAINFGPNTNGDEIRISPQLLTSVLSGWSARTVGTAAQRTAAQQAFVSATIRPPVFGLPSTPTKQRVTLATLKPGVLKNLLSAVKLTVKL